MFKSHDALLQEARDALGAADAPRALSCLSQALEHPGDPALGEVSRWTNALEVLACIAAAWGEESLVRCVLRVAREPEHLQAVLELGRHLLARSEHGLAASVLMRAYRHSPHADILLPDLLLALDERTPHARWVQQLRASPEKVEQDFFHRHQLALSALMTGDLEEPRRLQPGLEALLSQAPEDEGWGLAGLAWHIRAVLARAEALRGVTPLDTRDLRGWHFALTGEVLLHVSPEGLEGMHGRYARTQDTEARCLEGIRRVEAMLKAVGLAPPRVFVLPDRDSAILAYATARVLGVPAEPWTPPAGYATSDPPPGLIVAYDLGTLDDALRRSLTWSHPGQLLWSHAASWAGKPSFAADLATYLHLVNTPPWGERRRMGPVEELVERIVTAELRPDALGDLPTLTRWSPAMAALVEQDASGHFGVCNLFRQHTRTRTLRHRESPVRSLRLA